MDSIRVLIVDDSAVMRKIVERSLRLADIKIAEVLEAGDGAEALGVLNKGKVDLILCDINMPVMDGLEFVKQLSGVASAKGVPGDDHHRGQRSPCGAGPVRRFPGLHSQAVHSRSSQGTDCSDSGRQSTNATKGLCFRRFCLRIS